MFVLGRLIPAAFRALFRMIVLGLLAALLAGGITLEISYLNTPHWHWPPATLTIVATVAIALLAGYAVALTTLVQEVIRGVKNLERNVVKDIESEVTHGHARAS
jgi:uncharacterized membrane protein YbhN (UPF0104 family)